MIDGPAPSDQPNVLVRDGNFKSTIRAIKLRAPLQFDGRLDDEVYRQYPGFEGMLQASPKYNEPSTEQTEIWVMFDGDNIYIAAKCWDTAPPEKWIANELRRDTNQMRQNDHFGVGFDTFYDRRSGYMFYANPIGGFSDYSVVDEGAPNSDWNPVWIAKTGRFDGGWTIEMQFPFKSLRYTSGSDQVWGIQFRRSIRHKNEWTYWTPVPQNMAGPGALNRVSAYGTVVGLDLPPAGRNVELKPYALGKMTTDRLTNPPTSNDRDGDFGGDVKYGVTANLTADLTVNTDFAQVEIDEQQVNLTRFNLFLPEKREFFLEGRGLFDFGRGGSSSGGNFGGGGSSDTPYLFYTRRIGLNRGRVVPIDAGGRLTGKIGGFGVGVMNIRSGGEQVSASPATSFTVLRVKRDILRRSTIGAMLTNRNQLSSNLPGSNQAFGVDAALAFYQNVALGGYYARTETTNLAGDNQSYLGKFDWSPDRYGVSAEVLKVGREFNPEVGFLRRTDFTRSYGSARFSPRPKSSRLVRKYTSQASYEYYENGRGDVESRQATGRFNVEFNNSDVFNIEANANYDLLLTPFTPSPGHRIAAGGYYYNDVLLSYNMGQQRRLSGNIGAQFGGYYNGTIKSLSFSQARYAILKQFSVEPRLSITRIDLPASSFTTRQIGARTDYGFSPRMFASALLQYSSADHTFSSNVRFRWEYRPGSEVFVVWSDEQNSNPLDPRDRLALRNRAFVVKMTRLFRF
ncbi:MAG: carbohydrate binding family 9 domain-containing protein [Cyanobacteria bacterium]|nr:carbohydrate binding family 9 domain-containing protein [Cyanobacteriota bacterium]